MSRKDRKRGSDEPEDEMYDESERTLSHDDAFRDSVYRLPGRIRHIKACYMTQMKNYTKQRSVWLMVILLVIIPAAVFGTKYFGSGMTPVDGVANTLMSLLLSLMPVISILLATTACGTMLPAEFNERTVYISLPLPMSRFDFYLGKFLAGFTLTSSVIVAAYGISMLVSIADGYPMYVDPMLESLMLALSGMFFYCALTYMLSASSKRSSTLKTLIIAIVGIPGIAIVLALLGGSYDIELLSLISSYVPSYSMDMAILYLGSPAIMLEAPMTLAPASLYGLMKLTMSDMILGMSFTHEVEYMCATCLALGFLFFLKGYRTISRRDM